MKKFLILAAMAAIAVSCTFRSGNNGPAYLNPEAPIEERVEDALSRMTLEEKVAMTHAQSKFSSHGVHITRMRCRSVPG